METRSWKMEIGNEKLGRAILSFQFLTSRALSQKLVGKVFPMREGFSQPRQGRNPVAQGGSPGLHGLQPVPRLRDTPLSPRRPGEGTG